MPHASQHAERLPVPWCDLPPTGILYLRYRLSRRTNSEIAAARGCRPTTVSWHLKITLIELRRRTNLRLPDVPSMMVLAAQHGVPSLELDDHHPRADAERECCDTPVLA